jgi:hypothetical protein
VDFLRAFLGDMLSLAGYAAFFAALYKLFQISTQLDEIKELLKGQRRNDFVAQGPAVIPAIPSDIAADDAAAEYAKNLLRAVNAESQHAEPESKLH